MRNYTFHVKDFANIEDVIKIVSRMGWESELTSDILTITYPEEDINLADFIFGYWVS